MAAHPHLLKVARILLGWDQPTLAARAQVGLGLIPRLENGRSVKATSWLKVQRALEDGGVVFIEGQQDGLGPGVRLKQDLPTPFLPADSFDKVVPSDDESGE
ncbi:transcriptional regulator [Jiella sonneratiae]|uniref:Transcriptional regulator n=1 Tax=Jiella sonneratiae TaxID=2816856 RepID=A0ABS3IZ32_9HYPH|nr:transcriptional regulator [Jiella sonneratiae]MBO0902686.1 transcriptional regulator [Jiella sonneratiae]